jgi:hypothetical protein
MERGRCGAKSRKVCGDPGAVIGAVGAGGEAGAFGEAFGVAAVVAGEPAGLVEASAGGVFVGRLELPGGFDGQAGLGLFDSVGEDADFAFGLDVGAVDLAEGAVAILTQDGEELIPQDLGAAHLLAIHDAILDDALGMALDEGLGVMGTLAEGDAEAAEAGDDGDDGEAVDEGDVYVEGGIAGGGTEGDDEDDIYGGELIHAALAGEAQEGEEVEVEDAGAQENLDEEEQGQLADEDAIEVEGVIRHGAECNTRSVGPADWGQLNLAALKGMV